MQNSGRAYDRRTVLQMSGVAVAGALAGCSTQDEIPDMLIGVAPPEVGNEFDPEEVDVDVGATVQWTFESTGHTITPHDVPDGSDWTGEQDPDDEAIQDGDMEETHLHTFDVEGVYEYHCENHRDQGMEAELIVGDP